MFTRSEKFTSFTDPGIVTVPEETEKSPSLFVKGMVVSVASVKAASVVLPRK